MAIFPALQKLTHMWSGTCKAVIPHWNRTLFKSIWVEWKYQRYRLLHIVLKAEYVFLSLLAQLVDATSLNLGSTTGSLPGAASSSGASRLPGAMVTWRYGVLVIWCPGAGPMVPWCHGPLMPWSSRCDLVACCQPLQLVPQAHKLHTSLGCTCDRWGF